MTPPLVFISYSRDDKKHKEELCKYLNTFERTGELQVWDDTQQQPGDDWEEEIRTAVSRASLAVLIVTPNYLSSEFITKTEVPLILGRLGVGDFVIAPIIAEHCSWQRIEWLRKHQVIIEEAGPIWVLEDGHRKRVLTTIAEALLDRAINVAAAAEKAQPAATAFEPSSPAAAGEHATSNETKIIEQDSQRTKSVLIKSNRPGRLLTSRLLLWTALSLGVVILCFYGYVFLLAHAKYDSSVPINISDKLTVGTYSNLYIIPGDDQALRFKIASNNGDHEAQIKLDELGRGNQNIIGTDVIRKPGEGLVREAVSPPLKTIVVNLTSTGSFQRAPAHLGFVGQIDNSPFDRKEPLLYVSPLSNVKLLETRAGVLALTTWILIIVSVLYRAFKQA